MFVDTNNTWPKMFPVPYLTRDLLRMARRPRPVKAGCKIIILYCTIYE